ncbi:hypothetical protein ACJ41O_012666 [Fusarium nematophilum]
MSSQLIQVRTTGAPLNDREVKTIVDSTDGAQLLPSPLIFPPMFKIKVPRRGSQDLQDELKNKFGDGAHVDVVRDMD